MVRSKNNRKCKVSLWHCHRKHHHPFWLTRAPRKAHNKANALTTLCTDEATIYKGIEGYKQLMVNHSAGQ
jgi:hypothetical protein